MAAEFELIRDRSREYRWRLQSGNNRIIADSGEGTRLSRRPRGMLRIWRSARKRLFALMLTVCG